MKTLPNVSTPSEAASPVAFPVVPAAAAEGEAPASGGALPGFDCVLGLCTESVATASAPVLAPAPAPVVMATPSCPTGEAADLLASQVSSRSLLVNGALMTAPEVSEVSAGPSMTTTRSLRLSPTLAPAITSDDDKSDEVTLDSGEVPSATVASGEVPVEIRCQAVSLQLPLPDLPQPLSAIPLAANVAAEPSAIQSAPSANLDANLGNAFGVAVESGMISRAEQGSSTASAAPSTSLPVAPAYHEAPAVSSVTMSVPLDDKVVGTPESQAEAYALPAMSASTRTATLMPKPRTISGSAPAAEKIAATPSSIPVRTVASLTNDTGDKFLSPYKQAEAEVVQRRGTGNAKPTVDMKANSAPSELFTAEPGAVVSNMNSAVAPAPVVAPLGAASHAAGKAHQEISIPAMDAAGVVREVAELTHDFRMRERSSVEVKFNFKDETELSVRLAYRDGDVHTTFRTDSVELRNALDREWHSYAASFAQESRNYKIAEPVFTSAGDSSHSSQGRDAGSPAGGDARQQPDSSHPDQSGAHRAASQPGAFRSNHAAASSPPNREGATRISSDRLLHAFA